jgi:lipopolysaccharide biosynthesis glycosyltransferase
MAENVNEALELALTRTTPVEPERLTLPEPTFPHLARTSSELDLPFSDVTIIFAANEFFVPYLSVALQSIVENISPDRRYDIVVLSHDLTQRSIWALHNQVTSDNVGIGFLDAQEALGDIELPSHGHFRLETYYRLLAPELLPTVSKAIYLDCDLVVMDDLAKLYDTDVTGYLLAATQDADTIGQAAGYEPAVNKYLLEEVGLAEATDYLQAGVLVMNLDEFRAQQPTAKLLEVAASRHWQWLDQDTLNHIVRGHYKRVDMSWNVLMDWKHLRRTHIIAQAPAYVQAEYETAREHPRIIHYAGPDDRPWLNPNADFAWAFWYYAPRSPFYDILIQRLRASRRTVSGLAKRAQVAFLYNGIMPLFDALMPPHTPQRAWTIETYKKLGGNLI